MQEGDPITEQMVTDAVRSKLEDAYDISEIELRSGTPTSAAEATTYQFTVFVYTD